METSRPTAQPLRQSLLLLTLVTALGTTGYCLIEHWALLDAFYMTVSTIATVGFGEVHPLSPAGRVFTVALIGLGTGTVAYALSSMARYMIEGELKHSLRRRKMERKIKALKGHTIVCGYGRIGAQVVREIRESKAAVVVIERDEAGYARAERDGVLVVSGEASDEAVQRTAGVEQARVLVAAVGADTDNIVITLTARGLAPHLQIYARADGADNAKKLRRAGADRVVSPYMIGAHRLSQAVLRPNVVDFVEMATGAEALELQMEEFVATEGCGLVGQSLEGSALRREHEAFVLALRRRGSFVLSPAPTTVIEAGDTLIVLAPPSAIRELEKILFRVDPGAYI